MTFISIPVTYWSVVLLILLLAPLYTNGQRLNRSTASRTNRTAATPAVSRNTAANHHSINGGSRKSTQRNVSTRSSRNTNSTISRNRNTNINGNRVNIDNSSRNVNVNINRDIHVHNHQHTVVVHNSRPYYRPPYVWGGFSFYAYHPYYYHPYRPYYWGPIWHPWGFFVATLAATAIIITVENQKYHYDQGVYYVQSNGGYTVVQAPVGATIKVLPENSQTVVVNETTNNYYYGGTYYEKADGGYTVVPPTAGTVVEHLPEGGEEVKVGEVTYVKLGEAYYQPVQVDGKDMYEVVDVKEEEE
ncbi:DUF6515 family protein [Catalinimonas sp. 4WD22]|uniref:DUF6515 family protein n=1 Tax=Catalinimonas locisalis TaxID=3133978 RepID=UPI0031013D7F